MREPPGGKRVPCPGVVFLGESQVGWMWAQQGERPGTRRESLRGLGLGDRRHSSRSWLQKRDEIDAVAEQGPVKIYLCCKKCGHVRPANSYTILPEVLVRLRCRVCRGRFGTVGMRRAIVHDPEEYRRERKLGAWVETQDQRRRRIEKIVHAKEG